MTFMPNNSQRETRSAAERSPLGRLLWEPTPARAKDANITRFTRFINERYGTNLATYDELYDWSVQSIADFWAAVWDFVDIKASRRYERVVEDLSVFPSAKWFPGAKLNFAANLLRYRDDRPAIVFHGEDKKQVRLTYAELYRAVAGMAAYLREIGIKPGDRVVAYMPNLPETIVAMLAATSVGATWASCATDLGPQATIDRLGQLGPRVLFTVDGYFYKGKTFDSLANAAEIVKGIPSLEKVIVVRYTGQGDPGQVPHSITWDEATTCEAGEIVFEQMPFDHPVYIMFSSGTTGNPKCLVQGAGGILINHLKELIIQADLKREDRLLQVTTCSWMMWNWMVSALGAGTTVVLYDGNPSYPDAGALWRIMQDERITVFGTSASYINYMKGEGMQPKADYDLAALREITQTGSVLSAEGFEYVYDSIKADLHFNSISGGTDINGCFAIGSPTVPVYAGQTQKRGLGMKVECYDENGRTLRDKMGELVCEAPTPSMPLYFWNDPEGKRYRESYFSYYPNVWRHGDYVVIHGDTGGITFFGRSDSVLKPSGVRIGTAEIYNQVAKITEVADSLAVGQEWQGDQRIILFVKLSDHHPLDEVLRNKIKKVLKENASPRHVPAKIIEVPDIPYTLNLKKVESAVTNIVNNRPVVNRDALANPASLDYYEKILPELRED